MEIFQLAEQICDRFYELIQPWKTFDKETVGIQLTRAADSIGANFSESYGRYHYGEKLNFLYYSRGSLYETKYWVRRCHRRKLLPSEVCDNAYKVLNDLGMKLNAYITDKRNKRSDSAKSGKKLVESSVPYVIDNFDNEDQWFDDLDNPNNLAENYQSPNHQLPNQLF